MALFSLLSSLPYLTLFEKPGITREKFLYFCSSCLDGKQMELLNRLSLVPETGDSDGAVLLHSFPAESILCAYMAWETALRSCMAKIRAAKHPELPLKDQNDSAFDGDAENAARRAYSAANPLEREKVLDRSRWTKLEELEGLARIRNKHNFHFDTVCAYALKLMIAEKWNSRKDSGANGHLNQIADAVHAGSLSEKS